MDKCRKELNTRHISTGRCRQTPTDTERFGHILIDSQTDRIQHTQQNQKDRDKECERYRQSMRNEKRARH